jgi:hypothetical protein
MDQRNIISAFLLTISLYSQRSGVQHFILDISEERISVLLFFCSMRAICMADRQFPSISKKTCREAPQRGNPYLSKKAG